MHNINTNPALPNDGTITNPLVEMAENGIDKHGKKNNHAVGAVDAVEAVKPAPQPEPELEPETEP